MNIFGDVKINADSEANKAGNFKISNTKSLVSKGKKINLTAADLVLKGTGSFSAGIGDVSLKTSSGLKMGIGEVKEEYRILASKIERI